MSSLMKQPSVKLIPNDPVTNTLLIIYCVSSTGASVPYKSSWRRICSRKNKAEQIKYHNGSSYKCTPFDLDYVIEVTVSYQHLSTQVTRIVQSGVVRVARELVERRMYMREPVLSRMVVDEVPLDVKIFVHQNVVHVIPANPGHNPMSLLVQIGDLQIELDNSQVAFKMAWRQKGEEFAAFVGQIIGWKPRIKNNWVTFVFGSDVNRDLILLGISEVQLQDKNENQSLNMSNPNGKGIMKDLQLRGHSKKKSQTSFSPNSGYKQKAKIPGRLLQMKRSYTNGGLPMNDKKVDLSQNFTLTTPESKNDNRERTKSGEYLNVFEEDDLDFLASPNNGEKTPIDVLIHTKTPKIEPQSDQPSINLRGSFQQLEKSFHHKQNDCIEDRESIQHKKEIKKMQEEIDRLMKENESLRKQGEVVSSLAKENNSMKRKYLEMKEEVNRLEMERKVILTDKLRCEVNWHKEVQQKEKIKRQLETLKEQLKNGSAGNVDRPAKTSSLYEMQGNEKRPQNRDISREAVRSPNSSFHR